MAASGGSITLVFTFAAVRRLAEPAAALEDAARWSEVVGLVSDEEPERLSAYADRVGIDPDFLSSARGGAGGLAVARQQFPTERHVLVGTTEEDRQLAGSLGWEYLPVAEAADAADWSLAADASRWRERDDEE